MIVPKGIKVRDLSQEEIHAINALKSLAKKWPDSLWVFSASGTLTIMQCDKDGDWVYSNGYVDPDYIVTAADIPNDGGDW